MTNPIKMPKMWQEMVNLAENLPVATHPSSWDWEEFRTLVLKNNTVVQVYNGAQNYLPPEFQNHPNMIEIRLLAKINRLKSRQRIQALVQIAGAFQEREIPMLSFKGPLLSMELYGDPESRNSCDLDILVAEEKLAEATCCLQELGYQRQNTVWDATPKRRALRQKRGQQMHLLFRKDGIAVELHWRICYRFAVPFSTLWDSRRSFLLMGQGIYTMDSQENLCYLITHGAGHGYRQIRWLLEIHALLEKEDFQISQLYTKMKQRGVAVLLLETLLLLYQLPGISMPDRLCIPEDGIVFQKSEENTILFWNRGTGRQLCRARRLVKAVRPLLCRTNPEEGLDGRFYKHLLPTLSSRPPFLLSLFLPDTPELEWLDLPDRWFFLYYLLRPVHFLWAHMKKTSVNQESH